MKTITISRLAIFIFIASFISSCGFNPSSESSCKKTLTTGFWCHESGGEPLISAHGSFSFKDDGTCMHAGINVQTNGTWTLGEVHEVTSKITIRYINVTMEKEIGEGVGTNFVMELDENGKYISFKGKTKPLYRHFDDNEKPLN